MTARGNRRQALFHTDRDHDRFLELFARICGALAWECHAYCLMPNHYHLVVETSTPDLSAGMHRLNSGYAHWFNSRHGLDGHLFQGRFHAVLIESDSHLIELTRYLALNPLRAGLCAKPNRWPWGSYRFLADDLPAPPFLGIDRVLGYFGREPAHAREAFRTFVTEGGLQRRDPVPGTGPWPL